MKYFEATLIARGKKEVHNFLAVDRKEAMSIAQSGGMVVQVKEVAMPIVARLQVLKDEIESKVFTGPVKAQDWIVAMRQMGVMLNAGISLSDALGEAASATQDKKAKRILFQALEDVEAGFSLSISLEKSRAQVGAITMALITLGEKTGTLAESMLKLADMAEEIRDNRAKVKKATTMPKITLLAMAAAFVILIMQVVPKFQSVFSKLGADLPAPTLALIAIEGFLTAYWYYLLIGIIAMVFAHNWAMRNRPKYELAFDQYILRVYLIGSMLSLGFYSRFMMIFGQLIRSGIPLTESMATSGGTIENSYVRLKLAEAGRGIGQGKQLSTALDETTLFEPMVLQMIRSGESSGELDTMLERIGEYYRMRFNHLIDNFAALLEPILMLFMGVLVLFLALGIMLPMWDISSAAMGKTK
ncbi:MAG: type II secretion system F family protein [Helicobacteraceae bacterium]|jgi:general secretion pathway protein F/MSHA biogenesis protein MshG|nr:type II secretion system F family protein [Helicobacteraceae bacterium]